MSRQGSVWRHLLPVMVAVAVLGTGVPALAAERVALVIGNTAYTDSPLRNPINDARAMNRALTHLGFDVVLLTDGDQRSMQRSIGQFSRKLRGAKVALVYYSGHGIQAGGVNYMVPIGAQIESEGDMPLELVSVDAVMTQLIQAGTDVNILILDACRNNPFERGLHRGVSGGGGGLASIAAPKGTVIAYATAPGTTASDGDGENSPYTTALLRAMDTPGKKVEEVFKDTRVQLAKTTHDGQISWESSSLVGDFYFSAPDAAPLHAAAVHTSPTPNAPTPNAPTPNAQTPNAPARPTGQPNAPAQGKPRPAASAPEPTASVEPEATPEATPTVSAKPAQGARGKLVFDIVNNLDWRIIQLYLAPSSSEDWEENVLESPLESGETLEMTVDDDSSECRYDLRAVFKGHKDFEKRKINICKTTTYSIE